LLKRLFRGAGALREWMLKTDGQLLFPGVRGGPLPNNSVNRWYRRLADEADIRPISSHGARHLLLCSSIIDTLRGAPFSKDSVFLERCL